MAGDIARRRLAVNRRLLTSSRSTVPRAGERPINGRRRTILVPVDLGDPSKEALNYAMSHAQKVNSRILVLHVLVPFYGEGLIERSSRQDLRHREEKAAERKLNELLGRFEVGAVPVNAVIRRGIPEFEILKTAEAANAELIVIGRRNRSAFSRMIFGSVTGNLVNVSPVPVLVINFSLTAYEAQTRF